MSSSASKSSCDLWTNNSLRACPTNHGVVSEGGFIFSYSGSRASSPRVAVTFSENGWQTSGKGVKYFELTILNRGSRGYIAIGLVPEGYDQNSQPGWKGNSIGYHADDSGVFIGSGGHNTTIPPRWDQNDTITGCGIDYESRRIFFTREGARQGREFPIPSAPILFPAIGLHSESEQVRVNFGASSFSYSAANSFALDIRCSAMLSTGG